MDAAHVYVIDNTVVAKHDKFTGELVARWEASEEFPLTHMNSGMVRDGKLYVAHSNYPHLPMTGSLEIFDTETLTHVGSHSFGSTEGSFTWLDWHDGFWWGCFVHYDDDAEKEKDNAYSRVVKFDEDFREVAAWVLPRAVLRALSPHSASGGAWGPDNRIYISGHDKSELYALTLPRSGSTLVHAGTYAFGNQGQAIAFDRTGTNLVYGLVRKENGVVAENFDNVLAQALEEK